MHRLVGRQFDSTCLKIVQVRRLSAASVRARGKDHCGQAIKGMWGMSWRQKAMTGVEVCEKFGVADKRALIPKFPNDRILNP